MSVQGITPANIQIQQIKQVQQDQEVQKESKPIQVKPKFEPLETAEGAKAISEEALRKFIENLNELLSAKNTSVSLEYDKLSSPEKVNIIDTESGEVIRQIPPQAVIEIANKARDYIIGLIIDKKI